MLINDNHLVSYPRECQGCGWNHGRVDNFLKVMG